jgi:hypothetical protein
MCHANIKKSTSDDVEVRRSVVTYGEVLRHVPHMQSRKCSLSECVGVFLMTCANSVPLSSLNLETQMVIGF